jgi:hypothetical protein
MFSLCPSSILDRIHCHSKNNDEWEEQKVDGTTSYKITGHQKGLVKKKNMNSEEEGSGYYMKQKAIFIKTLLSWKGEILTAAATHTFTAIATQFLTAVAT